MKILIVCQFYYPENFVISKIAEELAHKGHDVSVLTGKPNYGYQQIIPEYKDVTYEEINGVKVHRVNLIPRKKSRFSIVFNYLSFWYNSKKWVKKTKEKFDVVYSMSLSPVTILAAGNLYKKKFHVPHVVHCVDLWPESVLVTHAVKKDSLIYKILYKWSKKLYLGADEILIGSPSFEIYFKNVLQINNIPISFVPQCSLIEDPKADANCFDNGAFNVVYCGNLGLIQLISLICPTMCLLKNENVIFHIIGLGPKAEQLKRDIENYGLSNQVIFYGSMQFSNAIPYLLSANALYVSLKKDGYVGNTIPNKLTTYLTFGKPIIGVLGGDGKEILMKTQNGRFICDENADSVAEAIRNLKNTNESERLSIGINNKNYYRENLSLKHVTTLIEEKLLSLIK